MDITATEITRREAYWWKRWQDAEAKLYVPILNKIQNILDRKVPDYQRDMGVEEFKRYDQMLEFLTKKGTTAKGFRRKCREVIGYCPRNWWDLYKLDRNKRSLQQREETMSFQDTCNCNICQPSFSKTDYYNKKKKEATMSFATAAAGTVLNLNAPVPVNVEVDQRESLLSALRDARDEKYNELRKKFNMDWRGPNTARELVEAIKADKFKFTPRPRYDDDYEDENVLYLDEDAKDYADYVSWNPISFIRWTEKKSDIKGFKTADEILRKLYSDAKLDIEIKSPEEGLKIVREFASADATVH